jgi:hypothetical protein
MSYFDKAFPFATQPLEDTSSVEETYPVEVTLTTEEISHVEETSSVEDGASALSLLSPRDYNAVDVFLSIKKNLIKHYLSLASSLDLSFHLLHKDTPKEP